MPAERERESRMAYVDSEFASRDQFRSLIVPFAAAAAAI
jgi:hypothetical protein